MLNRCNLSSKRKEKKFPAISLETDPSTEYPRQRSIDDLVEIEHEILTIDIFPEVSFESRPTRLRVSGLVILNQW